MAHKRKNPGKSRGPDRAGAAPPARRHEPRQHELPRYEPPVIERLGSLRDLLAVKSGPGLDPSPVHPFAKR